MSPDAAVMLYLTLHAIALHLSGRNAACTMVNKYPGLCSSSPGTVATVPLRGPQFLMPTLGMLHLWEALPKPAGSGLGSCAFLQPRALRISACSLEEPQSWEQGQLRLKKWAPQETEFTAFKCCGLGFHSCLMPVQHLGCSSCVPGRGC